VLEAQDPRGSRSGSLECMELGDAPSGRQAILLVRVEVALGDLMEFRGRDSSTVRAHLSAAAHRAEACLARVATALRGHRTYGQYSRL
jgi:hypothetical protein